MNSKGSFHKSWLVAPLVLLHFAGAPSTDTPEVNDIACSLQRFDDGQIIPGEEVRSQADWALEAVMGEGCLWETRSPAVPIQADAGWFAKPWTIFLQLADCPEHPSGYFAGGWYSASLHDGKQVGYVPGGLGHSALDIHVPEVSTDNQMVGVHFASKEVCRLQLGVQHERLRNEADNWVLAQLAEHRDQITATAKITPLFYPTLGPYEATQFHFAGGPTSNVVQWEGKFLVDDLSDPPWHVVYLQGAGTAYLDVPFRALAE